MRILHINSYYSVSPFYKSLYDLQAQSGLDLSVYVPVAEGYRDTMADRGAYTNLRINHGRYDRAVFHYKHAKILKDIRTQYNPRDFDLIHAHSLFSNGYIAHSLSREHGIPYIVAVRDTDVNTFFARMPHLRGMGRRILRDAKKVIFLSPVYRDNALNRYLPPNELQKVLHKSAVIPNGLDPMWLSHRGKARGARPGNRVNVLFVGQLVPRKNVASAIAAVKRLRDGGADARLTVIGKAVDAKELQKVKACPYAEYREPVDMESLIEIYRAHDLFLLPSRTETFGLVYAEAVSQGLPVLYTRGQGFDGQFPDGQVGYAIDPNDPMDIAVKATRILDHYEEISARCITACDRFDWRGIEQTYRALYGEAIKA